jgi:hypothetical protein
MMKTAERELLERIYESVSAAVDSDGEVIYWRLDTVDYLALEGFLYAEDDEDEIET